MKRIFYKHWRRSAAQEPPVCRRRRSPSCFAASQPASIFRYAPFRPGPSRIHSARLRNNRGLAARERLHASKRAARELARRLASCVSVSLRAKGNGPCLFAVARAAPLAAGRPAHQTPFGQVYERAPASLCGRRIQNCLISFSAELSSARYAVP